MDEIRQLEHEVSLLEKKLCGNIKTKERNHIIHQINERLIKLHYLKE